MILHFLKHLVGTKPQIREQMSVPDLHVFILKFLALKKPDFFSLFRIFVKKNPLQDLLSTNERT